MSGMLMTTCVDHVDRLPCADCLPFSMQTNERDNGWLMQAIDTSDAVIVLVSRGYRQSGNCRAEVFSPLPSLSTSTKSSL